MAIGEFYEVPEMDLRTATDTEFGYCITARRSMKKAAWVGEQWGDLAGRRPEDLPRCFVAVDSQALSPRTGWTTEYGRWEPKTLFTNPDLLLRRKLGDPRAWVRATLVFHPKDGSYSNLGMNVYNEISWVNDKYFLEEDITLCRVFRIPDSGIPGMVFSVTKGTRFGLVDGSVPVDKFPKFDYSDLYYSGFPYRLQQFLDIDTEGNSVDDWDLPSIDSSGGPKKRARSKPVGGSNAWRSFTKIYTKDPDVVYAACHHCGRMMKLKGGTKCGTKSLLRHIETCPCKPGSSMDILH